MLTFLITIIKLLVILCVVATIHEFGHFLFAKIFKMGVNEFSIGFGPKIFQKEYKGTKYSLRCLPLGGFCAIEGEDGESESESSFVNKSPLKRIIVLVAGVMFNAMLAVIIFMIIGFSVSTYNTKITSLDESSPLYKSGVQIGDEIYSVNGKRVHIVDEVLSKKSDLPENVKIEYLRNGKIESTVVNGAVTNIGYIGVSFKLNDEKTQVTNEIDMVASGGAAVETGLKSGDRIIKVGDVSTFDSTQIINIVKQNANKTLILTIQRDGEIIEKSITPSSQRYFSLGAFSTEEVKPNLSLALVSAKNNFKNIIGSYVDLFKGNVSVNEMSGIVGIGEVVSKTDSFISFLNLLGIISLAVGVANIMPFPPLDGGKVVLVLIEAITKKRVPIKVEAIISYIGLALLIVLTIFVTYNDIIRLI